MTTPPRWITDHGPEHSQWYIERFRKMAADGADLDGEARMLDAMLPRGSRVLDAGCGPGRVGAALHARGHEVVGVDVDPALIAAAEEDHPGPSWVVGDLASLDLGEVFDAVVVAGNVMTFLAVGSEPAVLGRLYAHLPAGGVCVIGFGTDRGYALSDFDAQAREAGFELEHRFATWDLRPWREGSDFAVSVLRVPGA